MKIIFKRPHEWVRILINATVLNSLCLGTALAAECVGLTLGNGDAPDWPMNQPLLTVSDFQFEGAFRFPSSQFGESSMHNTSGIIEVTGNKMFAVGKVSEQRIAEFVIPELVASTELDDLKVADAPLQAFVNVMKRAETGNPDGIDYITGMMEYQGKLIINAHKWYDGGADARHTTLILDDSSDLENSYVNGYFEFPDGPKSAGWIEKIPTEWQEPLGGGDFLTGFGGGTSILSRHTIGPSAHSFKISNLLSASIGAPEIPTERLLEFSLYNPLAEDRANSSGTNDLWTNRTGAWFGFIVPGTRTYATFGQLQGRESGVGYKLNSVESGSCAGYCPYDKNDKSAYYWLWDLRDLVAVNKGDLAHYEVRPYEYGEFPTDSLPGIGHKLITGGSYDHVNGLLYLMIVNADSVRKYHELPVAAAFSINSD